MLNSDTMVTKSDVTTAISTATANMVDSSKPTNFTAGLQSNSSPVITQAQWTSKSNDSDAQTASQNDANWFYYTEGS